MKPGEHAERLLLAATEHMEAQERTIERLEANKLGLELKASIKISALEQRVMVLEKALERANNYLQGLPTRDDYERLRGQVSDLSYNVPV